MNVSSVICSKLTLSLSVGQRPGPYRISIEILVCYVVTWELQTLRERLNTQWKKKSINLLNLFISNKSNQKWPTVWVICGCDSSWLFWTNATCAHMNTGGKCNPLNNTNTCSEQLSNQELKRWRFCFCLSLQTIVLTTVRDLTWNHRKCSGPLWFESERKSTQQQGRAAE